MGDDKVNSGTIGRQTASYRQGMVLGLTMAEIMLLLVFCLLIAVGVALASERARRDEVTQHLQRADAIVAAEAPLVESIQRNTRLAELFGRAAASKQAGAIDEFWRKLVESEDIVDAMEDRGLSRPTLRDGAQSLARFQQLRDNGLDPDKAARGAALASALDRVLPQDGRRTPEEYAALVEKGMTAHEPRTDGDRSDGHNWPPIINLSEAGGYYFATRSAELRPDFESKLRTAVVDRLLDIARNFPVDVIEVIGHTDERPLNAVQSNLDRELPMVMTGASGVGYLNPADNAGLGLARAVAVVKVLLADPRLRGFSILPLSGAQLIGTDGRLTRWDDQGDVRERRRIEIRMRRSG
jgi:outer membrane protein OmpA-like peptidoglycan-associated protein